MRIQIKMPFQNEHVFCFKLVLALTLLSCFSSLPNYEFKVFPVETCPLNKEAWNNSSVRLQCNNTRLYYCLPNRNLSSLIEFCYRKGGRKLFQKGNCLELAGAGYLNHVPCKKTFLSGCPDSFYLGDEIYKYPKCLKINVDLQCFESDTKCINSRRTIIHGRNITEEQPINITQKTQEFSTIQNTTTKWNSSDEHLENFKEKILECSNILVGNNTVKLNCSIEQTEGVTGTNFKNSSILVIALSVLLSISVLVLIVVIGTRIIKCRDSINLEKESYVMVEKHDSKETYDDSINSDTKFTVMVKKHASEETYDEMGSLLDDDELYRLYPESSATPFDPEETFTKSYESKYECTPSADKSMDGNTYVVSTCGAKQSDPFNFSTPSADKSMDKITYLDPVGEFVMLTNKGLNQSTPQSFSTSSYDKEGYETPNDAPSADKSMDGSTYVASTCGLNKGGVKNFSAPFYDKHIAGNIIFGGNSNDFLKLFIPIRKCIQKILKKTNLHF